MSEENTVTIEATNKPFELNWKELRSSLDLFYFLTWRDIKVRYKQTLLGVAWIILQPLISMVLFTIIFGNFAKIPSEGIPYPIFVFIGLVYWNFFSSTFSAAANSILSNESILKKVYFPKIMAPVSSTFAIIVDLVPLFIILAVMLFIYGITPSPLSLILIPVLLFQTLLISLGAGMFLAPINARFRDVRYLIPVVVQLGFFATPVIYPTTFFGGTSQIIRVLNPIAQIIDMQRLSLFASSRTIDWTTFGLSLLFSFIIFFVGFYFFRKQEDKILDYV